VIEQIIGRRYPLQRSHNAVRRLKSPVFIAGEVSAFVLVFGVCLWGWVLESGARYAPLAFQEFEAAGRGTALLVKRGLLVEWLLVCRPENSCDNSTLPIVGRSPTYCIVCAKKFVGLVRRPQCVAPDPKKESGSLLSILAKGLECRPTIR
jgi:hypothetical protein